MTVIPARVARVKEIVLVTPAGAGGRIDPVVLAAARIAGVTEGYRIGGAQAVAGVGYRPSLVRQGDKNGGPGQNYVAVATARGVGGGGIGNGRRAHGAAAAREARRRGLSGRAHARGGRRLCRRAQSRAPDRGHGAVRVAALDGRFREALERHRILAQRIARRRAAPEDPDAHRGAGRARERGRLATRHRRRKELMSADTTGRQARVERKTKEAEIALQLNPD